MKRVAAWAALSLTSMLAAACGREPAVEGPLHDVVAVAAADRWSEMERDVRDAIERRVSGVRDERVFRVTYQEPNAEGWDQRSRAPLLVVIGTPEDPWVREALERVGPGSTGVGLHRATSVWAEGQVVNVLVLPESGQDEDLDEHLEAVYAQLHADFRTLVRNRMYASGASTALADSLWENEGFGILVPRSYTLTRADSTFLFAPSDEDPSGVQRRVTVTWMNPAPPSFELDEVLAWRARTARAHYGTPQEAEGRVTAERLAFSGYVALEIRGHWSRRTDEGRQEGSLLTRVAVCGGQNRAYLLDSWLYAPDGETYEYIVQLETILDTFRCE
ncbi:MAG: DUF4837 family protein [Gemmatimonadales bacterium]